MTGKDLLPLVRGEKDQVYGNDEFVGYELTGHGVLFQGDFKLVVNQPPLGDGEWRLFNIVIDPAETNDLKALMPERFEQMMAAYEQFALENKVQELPQGYSAWTISVKSHSRSSRSQCDRVYFVVIGSHAFCCVSKLHPG